jgi:hypothetical protein
MKRAFVVMGFLAITVGGCAEQLQQVSSGHVGCPPEEIVIANDHYGPASSWQASCRGHTYQCSAISGHSSTQSQCTEMKPPVAAAPPPPPAPPKPTTPPPPGMEEVPNR